MMLRCHDGRANHAAWMIGNVQSGENAKSVKGRGRALNSKSIEVWGGRQGHREH